MLGNLTLVLEWAKFTEVSVHGWGVPHHLCPGACSMVQPPQEGFLCTAPHSDCPQRACANWAALQCRGCTGTETKILFVPGARLTYFFFFFTSYSLFDSKLGKKWGGHLNFTRHSTPHWHHAFDIYLKGIKLISTSSWMSVLKTLFLVTFQNCRDLGWADDRKRELHFGAQNIGRKVSTSWSAFLWRTFDLHWF